jgi:hypothetical protein
MKSIGVDLHGVLDWDTEYFKKIMRFVILSGNEVFVISGPPTSELKTELDNLGFIQGDHYTEIISIVDYLKSQNVEMWQDNKGSWWSDEESWWSSKAKICEERSILFMIDNTPKYKPYFDKIGKTGFILWKNLPPHQNGFFSEVDLTPLT